MIRRIANAEQTFNFVLVGEDSVDTIPSGSGLSIKTIPHELRKAPFVTAIVSHDNVTFLPIPYVQEVNPFKFVEATIWSDDDNIYLGTRSDGFDTIYFKFWAYFLETQ